MSFLGFGSFSCPDCAPTSALAFRGVAVRPGGGDAVDCAPVRPVLQ